MNQSQNELMRVKQNIDFLLSLIDSEKIGKEYKTAVKAKDKNKAIKLLADYFRNRENAKVAKFCGDTEYDEEYAINASKGIVKSIGISHTFEDGRIDFMFNPTKTNPPVNHEWLWQLNRHYFWSDMACVYLKNRDESIAKAFNNQLYDWVMFAKCPEIFNGPDSAWRTIECGLRLMDSWQTAFEIFRHSTNFTDENLLLMIYSMYKQASFVIEHPTKGNWYVIESIGAYTFSVMFPEVIGYKKIRDIAQLRLTEELEKQFLPDGLHNELSPDYFDVVFDCYASMYMLAKGYNIESELPQRFVEILKNASQAAVKLSTPAHTLPKTNDCYTIKTTAITNKARKMFPEFSELVNSSIKAKNKTASYLFPYAGFCVMRNDWSESSSYLCFDIGPTGMAHCHMDKLNIILFKGKDELLFDDGGGQYEISEIRDYGISAYDHNTVIVDGKGQNTSFPMIYDKPVECGWVSNDSFDYAYGIYDNGFGEKEEMLAKHKREVRFCKPGFYVVLDTLESKDGNEHNYEALFHIDTIKIHRTNDFKGGIVSKLGKENDILIVPLDEDAETMVVSAQKEPRYYGWYVGRNDKSIHPASTVIRTASKCKNYKFITLLFPIKAGSKHPIIKKFSLSEYEIVFNEITYSINLNELNE